MINIQHIIEMIKIEIGPEKEGNDRFKMARKPTVILSQINASMVKLASDSRAFITSAVHTLDQEDIDKDTSPWDNRNTSKDIPSKSYNWESAPKSTQWDKSKGSKLDGEFCAFLFHPANYIALKLMSVNGTTADEYGTGTGPDQPVFMTRPEGWFMAGSVNDDGTVNELAKGDNVYLEYFYYPQAEKVSDKIPGNPMCNMALFHLTMARLQERDSFVETSDGRLVQSNITRSQWHLAQYEGMKEDISNIARDQHHKPEGTIQPYYL